MTPPESMLPMGKWSGDTNVRGDDMTTSASPTTMTADDSKADVETFSPRIDESSTVQGTTVPPSAAAVDSPTNIIESHCSPEPTKTTIALPKTSLPLAISLVPTALERVPQRINVTPITKDKGSGCESDMSSLCSTKYNCLIAITVPFAAVREELQRRGVLKTFTSTQRTTTLLSVADKLAKGDHLKEWRNAVILEAAAGVSARVYEALTHGRVFVLSSEVAHVRYPRRKHISVAALNVRAVDAHTPYFVVNCNGRSRAVTFSRVCEEIMHFAIDEEDCGGGGGGGGGGSASVYL